MELRIENFTPDGNNLKWRQPFQNFQKEKCISRSKYITRNREYYNRMLYTLTDNRSIDVLNKMSMSGTSKISTKEFVPLYINSVKGKLSVAEMVQALMVVYPEQESPDGAKFLFGLVMRELKQIGDRNLATFVERITVSIDGIPVEIEASAQGVKLTPNARFNEIGDDEIFPTPTRTEDGIVRFTDPAQMSVPRDLPESVPILTYNRLGMPSNNELFLGSERLLETRTPDEIRTTIGESLYSYEGIQSTTRYMENIVADEAEALRRVADEVEALRRAVQVEPLQSATKQRKAERLHEKRLAAMEYGRTLKKDADEGPSGGMEAYSSLRNPDTTPSGVSIVRPARTIADMAKQRTDDILKDY